MHVLSFSGYPDSVAKMLAAIAGIDSGTAIPQRQERCFAIIMIESH